MKEYKFLDGSTRKVSNETCRGCYLEKTDLFITELIPVWENETFVIRQDAEIPLPGFYIVSTREHINTVADLDYKQAACLGMILSEMRKTMRAVLGIERIHIILEERMIEPHLHIWMLPLWPDVMAEHNIDPKVWNSNILEYLKLFKYENNRDTILEFNKRMADTLKNNDVLNNLDKALNGDKV